MLRAQRAKVLVSLWLTTCKRCASAVSAIAWARVSVDVLAESAVCASGPPNAAVRKPHSSPTQGVTRFLNAMLRLPDLLMKSLLKTLLFTTTLLAASLSAQALTAAPYSAEALASAQKAGKPVALQFHAPWCPTCRAQDKALAVLKAEPGAVDIQLLVVDYDSEVALKKALKVRTQSTLIVYRGAAETTRAIGITSPDDIRTALRTAVQ